LQLVKTILKRADGTPFPNEGQISVRIKMSDIIKPATRPADPRFSSGPCAKPPTWKLTSLADASLGRSHRAKIGRKKLSDAIEGTRELLKIPLNYKVAIVPASDTGAVEMALWSLLGAKKTTILVWESFGKGWATDVISQLKLNPEVIESDYGLLPQLENIDFNTDVVFAWNGTTSGVRVPNSNFIPLKREGLTICDATSAAFAVDLPWEKLDATTFSWQKVVGGEAAHGMLVLSPKAVERLENYKPSWPLPKLFRLTKNNKLNEDIFLGATINTPSMLAVEDYLFSLAWVRSIGGLDGMIERCNRNAQIIFNFVEKNKWLHNLAISPDTRSNTSVCLVFKDSRIKNEKTFAKNVCNRLEEEGVAFDIGSYRDAPAGLRIWCGGTVNSSNLKSLMSWIKWAFETEISLLKKIP
jgi:phosphoserine aminotransferase